MAKALPRQPHIDWLKKTAKQRLDQLRQSDPAAKLHQAQREAASAYGFASWRALKARVDASSQPSTNFKSRNRTSSSGWWRRIA